MRKALTLLALILLPFASFAQEEEVEDDEAYNEHQDEFINYTQRNPFRILDTPQASIGVYVAATPFFTELSFGGGTDLRVRYTNALSAGLSFTITGKKVRPDFGYLIGESKLLYYEFSLYNELDIYKRGGFEFSAGLNTGLSVFQLSDNSIKEPYYWYDEYGNQFQGERALTIANNYFFRLAPYIALRYDLAYRVALEAKAGYNFHIGGAKFGHTKDFNNFQLQIGARIDLNF